MALHPDFKDLLQAFADAEVRYMVVGGYAVAFHAKPRFTKDLDLWVSPTAENLDRVRDALTRFGAPRQLLDKLVGASSEDVLWMGVPPTRIDIVKGVPGGDFEQAYAGRARARWDDVPVMVIGLDDLIAIKRASGRRQDELDLVWLERAADRQRR